MVRLNQRQLVSSSRAPALASPLVALSVSLEGLSPVELPRRWFVCYLSFKDTWALPPVFAPRSKNVSQGQWRLQGRWEIVGTIHPFLLFSLGDWFHWVHLADWLYLGLPDCRGCVRGYHHHWALPGGHHHHVCIHFHFHFLDILRRKWHIGTFPFNKHPGAPRPLRRATSRRASPPPTPSRSRRAFLLTLRLLAEPPMSSTGKKQI